MATHHPFTLQVGPETLASTITRPEGQTEALPTIFLIHGGGASNHQRTQLLAEYLALHGHTSLRFDHSGHGASTGTLPKSSLSKRLQEAQAFLPLLHPTAPLTVFGSSMGAHTATSLLGTANFQTLIAQVPAAYATAAETIPFGEEIFTTTIRTPESWQDSTLWPRLNTFTGTFLLISGGLDTVIPQPILRAYWHNASNATKRTHFYMPGAEHKFTNWLDTSPGNRAAYFTAIRQSLPR